MALSVPVFETIGLTLSSMTLSLIIAVLLGMATATRIPGENALATGLSIFRAVPDLTLAILCVILLGIGPAAGMLALGLYYAAAMARVFGDLLREAPCRPVEAIATAGATRLQIGLFARLPLMRADMLDYFAFAFECALRASVIVGAVGGGGIGVELVGSLSAFDFQRSCTLIIILILIIALLDRLMVWLRAYPRFMIFIPILGLLCAVTYWPDKFAFAHAANVLARMLPPHLPEIALARLPALAWETIWMAFIGTAGAALAGTIASLLAARRIAPALLGFVMRRLLELLRTIPELVWGLLLVAISGVGPTAGALALGLHSFGSLGRIFADAIDNAPKAPIDTFATTGASRFSTALWAMLPLAWPAMLTHIFFRLEWNLRMATVLGLIGAGGVGQALYEAQQLFFYDRALAYIIVTAALILITDRLAIWIRARLRRGARAGKASPQTDHEPSIFIRPFKVNL